MGRLKTIFQIIALIIPIFINITLIRCNVSFTMFKHNVAYNGKRCSSADAVFEDEFDNVVRCTFKCFQEESCVGVFYSESSSLCTGCGNFNLGDLEDSTDDAMYFYNCAETVHWERFADSAYMVYTTNTQFDVAKSFCQDKLCIGLVHFEDLNEANFVNNLAHESNVVVHAYFTGLEYDTTDNLWRWGDDNTEATFTNWAPSDPNGAPTEACVLAWKNYGYGWIDYRCSASYPFVCEKNRTLI